MSENLCYSPGQPPQANLTARPFGTGRLQSETAVGIAAAYTGYTLPIAAAGVKVLAYRLDPFGAKIPECIGILLIIPAAKMYVLLHREKKRNGNHITSAWSRLGWCKGESVYAIWPQDVK